MKCPPWNLPTEVSQKTLRRGQFGNPMRLLVDRRFGLGLLVRDFGPLGHFGATERATLVGTERTQTLARESDLKQLLERVDVDLLLVELDLDQEAPARELRAGDADGRGSLGLIANALALVHDPGQISLCGDILENFAGDGVGIHERQIDAQNGKELEQRRRLGRADLLLAVLDLLASADQGTDKHLDGQCDDTVVVAVDLLLGLIDRRAILLLGRTDAGVEALERRFRHHVHHEGGHAADFNQRLLHTVLLESLARSAPKHME